MQRPQLVFVNRVNRRSADIVRVFICGIEDEKEQGDKQFKTIQRPNNFIVLLIPFSGLLAILIHPFFTSFHARLSAYFTISSVALQCTSSLCISEAFVLTLAYFRRHIVALFGSHPLSHAISHHPPFYPGTVQ